ncbi:PREDICTED: uncharacterized protein LOC106105328 [Papilio polytes]|uniref:uncharacterized protein LOC106105328 n=1 Tax=Papilio polytes TaxID=76194 RepID=UPI000675D6CE|nr:PREDICTED: uncharacterized protein LOC106105328 [Papilio polytes]
MFLWLVTVVLVLWIALFRFRRRRMYQLAAKIPGPSEELPIIGIAHLLAGGSDDVMKALQHFSYVAMENDGYVRSWIGPCLYFLVIDPVDLEYLLKNCLEKDDLHRFIKEAIGNGGIFAPVPIWRRRRKILVPAFRPKIVENFVKTFSEQSEKMVLKLTNCANKGPVKLWNYISTFTLDSVCETAMGVKINAQDNIDTPFLKSMQILLHLIGERVFHLWLQPDWLYRLFPRYVTHEENIKVMHDFTNKVISNKREELKLEKDRKSEVDHDFDLGSYQNQTFLDLLVRLSGGEHGYSDVELREEILTLMVAGTDTSAIGLGYTLKLLAMYPKVQEKIYEELRDVFGDSDRPLVKEDLLKLKYLERVVKETLRLFPPVPFIIRKILEDVTLPSGRVLPAGSGAAVSIWGLHRDPKYWGPDAEVFDPDRFSPERYNLKHTCSYIPFSSGPRNCLGYQYALMSMKIALSAIVRRYKVVGEEESGPVPHIESKIDIMMKAVDGYKMGLEKRDSLNNTDQGYLRSYILVLVRGYVVLIFKMFLWLLCLGIVLCMALFRLKRNRLYRLASKIPGPDDELPFIGIAHSFTGTTEEILNSLQKYSYEAMKNNGILRSWLGHILYFIVVDPVDLEVILKTCLEKDDLHRFIKNVIGNGGIFAPVPIWRKRRKVMVPAFSPKIVETFIEILSEQSGKLVSILAKCAGKGEVKMGPFLNRCTLDSVCETTMGIKTNAQNHPDAQFLKALKNMLNLVCERIFHLWLQPEWLYKFFPQYTTHQKHLKEMQDFVDEVIRKKREEIKNEKYLKSEVDRNFGLINYKTQSLLDLLIEFSGGENGYTDLELREEIMTLTVAGTDTSAVSIGYTLKLLALYPNVQEKLYQELLDVLGSSDRPIVKEDLLKLKYLDRVMKESLRLFPPVPFIIRKVLEDISLPSGRVLPAGSGAAVSIWGLHRDPKYWGPDAEVFDPDRFLPERFDLKHPCSFMPFSSGPRNCVGYQYALMSMKITLSAIVRRYKIVGEEEAGPVPHIKSKIDIMMKAVDDCKISLEKRIRS